MEPGCHHGRYLSRDEITINPKAGETLTDDKNREYYERYPVIYLLMLEKDDKVELLASSLSSSVSGITISHISEKEFF